MLLIFLNSLLILEEIDEDIYRSKSTWTPAGARGVFGGNVVGQSLVAAQNTVSPQFTVHSLHCYFLRPGLPDIPILYKVYRLRTGRSYATRTVEAVQKGKAIFTCTASFQVIESGQLEHQWQMPDAPDPESLESTEKFYERVLESDSLRSDIRKMFEQRLQDYRSSIPMDMRPCSPLSWPLSTPEKTSTPRQLTWMRTRGTLGNRVALHHCVAAYASDFKLVGTSLLAHGEEQASISMVASLDHSMWFHAPFRADEWMLYELESPRSCGGRGLNFGRIFTKDGVLAVTVAQEGLMRVPPIRLPPSSRREDNHMFPTSVGKLKNTNTGSSSKL